MSEQLRSYIELEEFYTLVRAVVPGAPEASLDAFAREAAIRLCTEAPVWREDSIEIPTIEGQRYYPVLLNHPDARPHSILGVWYGSCRLDGLSHHDLALQYETRQTSAGNVQAFSMTERGILELFGSPGVNNLETLRIACSIKPSRDADELPQFLMDDYHEPIRHGMLGELLMMPGQGWTDYELAGYHAKKANEAILAARAATDRGYSTGPRTGNYHRRNFVRPYYRRLY